LASYNPNTSIEHLEFNHVDTVPTALLKSLRGVRSMYISESIHKEAFKNILKSLPGLMQLKVGNADDMDQNDFEDIYKEVRSVEPSIVESLEVKIGENLPFILKL
jgi:hypothetical protein